MTAPAGAELLSGGDDREPRRLPRRAQVALAVVAVLVGLAVLLLTREEPRSVPAPTLAVLDDGIGVTTSGVIVLSVELRDGGEGLAIRSAQLTAMPVLQPASVNTPPRVRPGGTVRLLAIVQPDCRALGRGQASSLEAALVVRVSPPSGGESDLRLDLSDDPVLLGRLRGLCAQTSGGQGGPSVSFRSATSDRVEATISLGTETGAVELRAITAPGLRFTPGSAPLPARIASGTGVGLPVAVTVEACADVARPPVGSNPDAHVWGVPALQVATGDSAGTLVRPEPAAVAELYSTAVRRIVENACDGPPR